MYCWQQFENRDIGKLIVSATYTIFPERFKILTNSSAAGALPPVTSILFVLLIFIIF